MSSNQLMHYGVPGMKWGVRRGPSQLGRASSTGKKKKFANFNVKKKVAKKNQTKPSSTHQKGLREMTDAELKNKISRLELEKKYKDLSKSEERAKSTKGKQFVMDVLEKSGKNIAVQATTYALGTAVNKALGSEVVNPKKGQKDK